MLPTAHPNCTYQQENERGAPPTGTAGARETGANGANAMMTIQQQQQRRAQWDARLASFQRGLDHVMHCSSGGACGSSLCHATRRLMRTYATHDCTNPSGVPTTTTSGDPSSIECKVCKLWGYILTKNQPAARGHHHGHGHGPVVPGVRPSNNGMTTNAMPTRLPMSCGLASTSRRMAAGGGWHGHAHRGPSSSRILTNRMLPSASSRRVVVTEEMIKAMAKRV